MRTISCDYEDCDVENLPIKEAVMIGISVSDPEAGMTTETREFCTKHADQLISRFTELGFTEIS